MKRLLISLSAVLLMAAAPTVASAGPLGGSFNISVYQANCGSSCNINSTDEQAVNTNPLITAGDLIASGTYTGNIGFAEPSGGANNIKSFLLSDGGALGGTLASLGAQQLSTGNFDLTTVFVITGNVGSGSYTGNIVHDDGASLYVGSGYSSDIMPAPGPVSATTTGYSGLTGAFELIYVEANDLPADLTFNVDPNVNGFIPTSTVPEPLTLSLFGAGLVGAAALRRRKKKAA